MYQEASRILCNTLHKEREAPFSCKRTDTDRLGITGGGMNPALRSPKTVRREVRPRCPLPRFMGTLPLFYFPLYHPLFFIFPHFYRLQSLFSTTLSLSFRFPGSFLPSSVGFIRCKGLLSRLILRLEVHFLQILPFCERVIGRKSRRMKLYRQPGTASIKSRNGSGRERNRKEGKKKTT